MGERVDLTKRCTTQPGGGTTRSICPCAHNPFSTIHNPNPEDTTRAIYPTATNVDELAKYYAPDAKGTWHMV